MGHNFHRHPSVMANHTFDDLKYMIFRENIPALEQALNEGADVNMLDYRDGGTLLKFAACNGKVEALQVLVDSKASLDIQAKDGVTALHLAAAFGIVEALQFLLDSKASLDFKNKDGKTALDFAQEGGHTGCAELLIAAALGNDLSRVAQTN